jgi:GNAT superfamily N-acetyltransferase
MTTPHPGLLVRAATVSLDVVDPAGEPARAAVARYVAELDRRFPSGFAPGVPTDDDHAGMRAPRGIFVVAVGDGVPVACGGVQTIGPGVAEVKRMWVDPDWRGAGLGARLLRRLEDEARALGHASIRLDTNGTLTEAIAMYHRAGYRSIDRYNDNPYAQAWFEKELSPPPARRTRA